MGGVQGASESVEGSPAVIDESGIPVMVPGDVIEGGRAWQLLSGTVLDVPAGMRLRHLGWGYVNGVTYASFEDVASGWWQEVNTTALTGAGRGQAGGADAAAQHGDVPAIFDRMLESLRRISRGPGK